ETDSAQLVEQQTLEAAGINIASAMARLGRDHNLLYRLVKVFASSTREVPGQIQSALETNNLAEAIRLVHALKGTSGNIAADKIYLFVIDLEQNLIRGENSNAVYLISELNHLQEIILVPKHQDDFPAFTLAISHSEVKNREFL